jgi:hypothetical protein
MKAPNKRWKGHTWVGWLNLILLRWFFIRLAYEDSLPPIRWALIFRWPWRW